MVAYMGRPEIGDPDAKYLGDGLHELGHCNTAEMTKDPPASHARCDWVYWSKAERGWRTCKCACHPIGHEANEVVRDVIVRYITKEQRIMADEETKATRRKATKKAATGAPKKCECGCDGQTKGGRFLPGHDSKLKSRLQREYRGATTKRDRDRIYRAFQEQGWERFVPALEEAGN